MLRQLQRLWDEPQRVTQMADAALMRQDSEGETFDLPAYRELLFLYSIARDLGEHPSNARASISNCRWTARSRSRSRN